MPPILLAYLTVLLSRLFFYYGERPMSPCKTLSKSAIEIIAVLFALIQQSYYGMGLLENSLWLLLLVFPMLNLWVWFKSSKGSAYESVLVAQFIILCISFVVLMNGQPMQAHYPLAFAGVYLLGALACMNEMNTLFRWLMDRLSIKDKNAKDTVVDEAEYNRGRVIGILERLLIFAMAACNQYTAIGFVLGLKAAIRFPELKDRAFAEYVLIGTLLSTIMAITMALIIGLLTGRL